MSHSPAPLDSPLTAETAEAVIERAAQLTRLTGREPASVEEARKLLSLA